MSSTLSKDSVWFVTGCSSGLGKSFCEAINAAGYRLVATARKPTTLSYLPDSPTILKLTLDVTSSLSIGSAIQAALSKFGRIDVVVNNAGYALYGDTEALTEEQMRAQMETNFWGPVNLTREALKVFREVNPRQGSKGGTVVQVTSVGGRVGLQGSAMYHASKFGLEGFTESVAKEVHPDWNIRFLILEPGGTKTDFAEGGMIHGVRHPAYTDPGCPTNQFREYMAQPGVSDGWTDPGLVANVLLETVEKESLPIRLPTGRDAYAFIKGDLEQKVKDHEAWKDVSLSCVAAGETFDGVFK